MDSINSKKEFKKAIYRFAFIFLLVVLILTFFSKTINQMLLPQVTLYVPSDKTVNNTYMFSESIKYENTAKAYPEFSYFIDKVLVQNEQEISTGMPVAKLREKDVEAMRRQFEIEILTLEDSIKTVIQQMDARYIKEAEKEHLQRQLDILNLRLENKNSEKENYFNLIDENYNLLSTAEGKVLLIYIDDRSYCDETTPMFEYIAEDSYPVLQWELPQARASLFDISSRIYVQFSYIDKAKENEIPEKSSRNLNLDYIKYNYSNDSNIYTVILSPEDSQLLSAAKLDITLSNNISTLKNAVPKSAVVLENEDEGTLYLLVKDEETDKYTAKEVSVVITAENDAYYGIDYDFMKNDQVIVSTTKPLSDGAVVKLR